MRVDDAEVGSVGVSASRDERPVVERERLDAARRQRAQARGEEERQLASGG